MLNHTLRTAFKYLRKNPGYALVNLLGLAIGLVAAGLIFIYINIEMSYDRHFQDADQILRIGVEYTFDDKVDQFANIARPMGKTLQDEFGEVKAQTRVLGVNGLFTHSALLSINDSHIKTDQIFFADSTYFLVFNQNFLHGDPTQALNEPNSIVVNTDLAMSLFGATDVMGNTIKLDNQTDLKITGVISSDQGVTHLPIQALVSWFNGARPGENSRWLGWHTYTYIKLHEGTDISEFNKKLPALYDKHMKASFDGYGGSARILTQPLVDIHLKSDLQWEANPNGSLSNIYIFSTVGVLILMLILINYINLSTARTLRRTKEIGLRKVLGSSTKTMILTHVLDSTVVTFFATLLAFAITYLLLPEFSAMSGISTDASTLWQNDTLFFFIIVFVLISGLSSIFPALHSIRFKSVEVLNNHSPQSISKSQARKILVSLQFIIAAGLLFSTSVVLKQNQFILDKDLGFEKESTMVVSIKDTAVQKRIDALKLEWQKHPAVNLTGATENAPGEPLVQVLASIKEIDGAYNTTGAELMYVDYGFTEMMGMTMVTGRSFNKDFGQDGATKILINETAAKLYGGNSSAIGRKVSIETDENDVPIDLEIIGVIKDFHTVSLHTLIQPILLVITDTPNKIVLKLNGKELRPALSFVETEWANLNSAFPLEFTFLDDGFKNLHKQESELRRLLIYFSVLIVLIAIMGLIGLVTHSVQSRMKEVTIRKVIGSSNSAVFRLLLTEYLKPILLSFIVAIPLGWYLMDNWLNDFAYHTSIDAFQAFLVVIITIIVAFASICYHTISASRQSPIKTLRHP